MIIGSDLSHYNSIASAIGTSYKFRGIRYYAGGGSGSINIFPTPWPIYGPHTTMLISVYPDLRDLLAGRLDEQIRDMVANAPPGAMLTAWHEVLSLKYKQKYLTPANVYLMHRRMNTLCRGSNVTYGCLLGGGDLPTLFRYLPANLGYYGLDLYGNLGIRTHPRWAHPFHRWTQFRDLAKTKDTVHHYPRLVIGETNCPDQALRPAWFKLLTSWVHSYGPNGKAILSFWNDYGGLSGPWDPSDQATISALRGLCSKYGQ